MPVSDKSITQQSSHQLYVIRVSSMTANKVDDLMESYRKLALEIASGLELGSVKSYTETLKRILETKGYFAEYQDEVIADIAAFAAYEVGYQADLLAGLFIDEVKTVVPTEAKVLGRIKNTPLILGERAKDVLTWQQMIDAVGETASKGIQSVVTRAYFSGDINGIRKFVNQSVDASKNGVKATVRTMYQHAAAQSKQALYAANDDLVIGYQIVATLDSRTTHICRIRDKQIYYYKDAFNPMLPFHYGERSTDVPVLSPEYEIDRSNDTRPARGANGGQTVSDNTTQMEFIKSQPAFWQDDALGKVRADLLRNSGLSPEEFKKAMSDQFDQPLTLKEMAAKDARINDYMKGKPDLQKYTTG